MPTFKTCCACGLLIAVLGNCAPEGARPAEVSKTPDRPGPVRFSEHLIMDNYAYAYGICASDLDRDGDLDLTSADYRPHNNLYWFENNGSGNFSRRFIQRNDPERLERHLVGDINYDTHPDVVIVKNFYGHLLWFENPGHWEREDLWKRHVVTTQLAGAYDVALADLDGDGDLDVAASSWRMGNQFAWFENQGTPCLGPPTQLCFEEGREWPKHLVEANVAETRTIRTADFDGDGDEDLLGTAAGDGLVLWYENSGVPASVPWKRRVIDTSNRPMHGEPADLDGDGDMDVVMALGMGGARGRKVNHQVVWYENDVSRGQGLWVKHVIHEPFQDAFEVAAGDLDGDGDLDVAATAWGEAGQVVWLENPGNPKGSWSVHRLKKSWRRANQVILADLDGDGGLDVAAVAEVGSNEFRWWRNEGRPTASNVPHR